MAQTRYELTSECAPRQSVQPWSHIAWQEFCFRCTPPPGWSHGSLGGSGSPDALPSALGGSSVHSMPGALPCSSSLQRCICFPGCGQWIRSLHCHMQVAPLMSAPGAPIALLAFLWNIRPSASSSPLTSICVHVTLLCLDHSLPSALCLPSCWGRGGQGGKACRSCCPSSPRRMGDEKQGGRLRVWILAIATWEVFCHLNTAVILHNACLSTPSNTGSPGLWRKVLMAFLYYSIE